MLVTDISTAFDDISDDKLFKAVSNVSRSPGATIASMRDLCNKFASMRIPASGDTEHFFFQRGGWQGGAATPALFNTLIADGLKNFVASWQRRHAGLEILQDGELPIYIPLSILADNLVIFSMSSHVPYTT